jgi:hypothetical protein
VENPCIVLFLMHKTVKEAKIVLRDQSWYTWATFIGISPSYDNVMRPLFFSSSNRVLVRDVTPYPNENVMQIEDQK